MFSKKKQSFYDFVTPNKQMSFAEYVSSIAKDNVVSVRSHTRRKHGKQRKTVLVRRYERRKRKQ